MQALSSVDWALVALAALLMSAGVTRAAIAYARRRNLVDLPGRRRSHVLATPRGGGIGIVVGVLLGNAALFWISPHTGPAALVPGAAVLLVAAVGWLDDHRNLGVGPRLIAHGLAATLLLGWTWAVADGDSRLLHGGVFAIALVALVWSINLHNFMDGIDGLLASQALFVFAAVAGLGILGGRIGEAQQVGLFAAATLGFLPFNFPRARIFMGDVGSGVLGLLVAVAVGWQMLEFPVALASGLIACSAFVVDATATLVSRMLRGRRWYSAHREHLYQWLVRSGRSHAAVVAMYAGWNLLVVVPVLYWINRPRDGVVEDGTLAAAFLGHGGPALLGVYALALLAWLFGKRHCLGKARHAAGGNHV